MQINLSLNMPPLCCFCLAELGINCARIESVLGICQYIQQFDIGVAQKTDVRCSLISIVMKCLFNSICKASNFPTILRQKGFFKSFLNGSCSNFLKWFYLEPFLKRKPFVVVFLQNVQHNVSSFKVVDSIPPQEYSLYLYIILINQNSFFYCQFPPPPQDIFDCLFAKNKLILVGNNIFIGCIYLFLIINYSFLKFPLII